MFCPGREAISHKIVAKYHILRQMSYFGPIFEVKLRVLTTHRANSVQTTTHQSTLVLYKSIEYAQLWSGGNILRDNTEKNCFGGTWPFLAPFRDENVRSLDPEQKFMFNDRAAIRLYIKLKVWNG